ncbi:hypothetical protein C0J52_09347 [Blattella germanica]|nr:hypothetical protein C0J52_09347 [Blattella germanica]
MFLAAVLVTSHAATVPEEKIAVDGEPIDRLGDEATGGERLKRSGDLLGYIGGKIGSKIQQFASASAGLSGASSGGSSHPKPEYGPPTTEAKSFDFWTFKKALLNTLLQAVKAIKGGIIALKGQIIKAKGHILTTKGRIITAKGEAISNFGKHVASSALMLDKKPPAHPPAHPPPHHPPSGHAPSGGGHTSSGYASGPSGFGATGSYTSGSAYGGPPPPSTSYGVPSGPSSLYGAPFKLTARGSSGNGASKGSLPAGTQAGLLVIKPIPSSGSSGRAVPSYTSNLHDFFGSQSQPVAAIVAAPSPFAASTSLRRSDSSSFTAPERDYSIIPEFSSPYDF